MNENRVRRIIIFAIIGVVALWAVIIGAVMVVQAGRGASPTPTAIAVVPTPTATETASPSPTAPPTAEPTGTPTPEPSPTPPPTVTPVPETATPSPTKASLGTGKEIDRGDPNSSMIALTFDAGSGSEPTPKILDTLKERGIHVTVFLTGQWIEQNPELVKRIAADGHEIGNHTYSHPDLTTGAA
ncbi:MAG: polysaccharide deacetylase family protein, partial [Chloroflexi bacterium]|nr:polysaccharide deacetylase family protein [Chloroflexota bacterium]